MVRIFILRQGKRDGRTDVDHRGKGEGIVSSYGVSYEKAADFLKKFTGLEVFCNKIHKLNFITEKKMLTSSLVVLYGESPMAMIIKRYSISLEIPEESF